MVVACTCTSCGLIQALPGERRQTVRCARCDYKMVHRAAAGPWEAVFWVFLLLSLFSVAVQDVFMSFTFAGGTNRVDVARGAFEVVRLGSMLVGVAVLFCSVIGPVLWGLGMLYAVSGLAVNAPLPGTAGVLRLMEKLRPWVMLEVFLLGVVVTAGKLGHDGKLGYGRGFYLYLGAMAVWIVIAKRVKNQRLWERLRPSADIDEQQLANAGRPLVGCQTCGLAQRAPRTSAHCDLACARCHAGLTDCPHAATRRCVVLLLLAMLLLLPANLVPIMRIAKLGPPEPATVWQGIKVLYFEGSPGLAALVFVASLCVPILKVVVIGVLVLWRHPRRCVTARRLAKVHRLVATIGRWSMVDMFVVALLIGLVRLGSLASVDPKPGAVAFLAVVLITIAAAEELNPKLFWERTETHRNE